MLMVMVIIDKTPIDKTPIDKTPIDKIVLICDNNLLLHEIIINLSHIWALLHNYEKIY